MRDDLKILRSLRSFQNDNVDACAQRDKGTCHPEALFAEGS